MQTQIESPLRTEESAATTSSSAVSGSFISMAAQYLQLALADQTLSEDEKQVHAALESMGPEGEATPAASLLNRYVIRAQLSGQQLTAQERSLVVELASLLQQHPQADLPGLSGLLRLISNLLMFRPASRELSAAEQQVVGLVLTTVRSGQLDQPAIDRLLALISRLALQDAKLFEGVYSGLDERDVALIEGRARELLPATSTGSTGSSSVSGTSLAEQYRSAALRDGTLSAAEETIYQALQNLPAQAQSTRTGAAVLAFILLCQNSEQTISPTELALVERLIHTLHINPSDDTPGFSELLQLFTRVLTVFAPANRSASEAELSLFSKALTLVRSAQYSPSALGNVVQLLQRLALENAKLYLGAYSGLSVEDIATFTASAPPAGSSSTEATHAASAAQTAATHASDPALASALQSAAAALRQGAHILQELAAWNIPPQGADAALSAIATARSALAPFVAQNQRQAMAADAQLATLSKQLQVGLATAEPDLRLFLSEQFKDLIDAPSMATLPLAQLLQLLKLDGPVLRGLIGCGMRLSDAIRLAPSVSLDDIQRSAFTSKLRDRLQLGDSADDALLWARYQGIASDAELSDAQFRSDLSEAQRQTPQAPLTQHVHEARCLTLYRRLDGVVSLDTLRTQSEGVIAQLLSQSPAVLKALLGAGVSIATCLELIPLMEPSEAQSASFLQLLQTKISSGLPPIHALIWARYSNLATAEELNDPEFLQDLVNATFRRDQPFSPQRTEIALSTARARLLHRRLAPLVPLETISSLDPAIVRRLLGMSADTIRGFLNIGVPLAQIAQLSDAQQTALLRANPHVVQALLNIGMQAVDVATYADTVVTLPECTADFLHSIRYGLSQGLSAGAAIVTARYGNLVSPSELSNHRLVERLLFPGLYGIPQSSASTALSIIHGLGYARNNVNIFEAAEKLAVESSNHNNRWFANAGVFQLSSLSTDSSAWDRIQSLIGRSLSQDERRQAIAAAQGLAYNWDYLCTHASALNLSLRRDTSHVLDFTQDNLRRVNYSPLIAQLGNTPVTLGNPSMNILSALDFLRGHISLFEAAEHVAVGSSNPRNGWFANAGVFQLAYLRVDSGEWDQIQNTLGYALSQSDRATAIAAARGVTDHWSTLCSWAGSIGLSLRRGTSDVLDFKDNNLGEINFGALVSLIQDPASHIPSGSRGPHQIPSHRPLAIDQITLLQHARAQTIVERFLDSSGNPSPGADLNTVLSLNLSSEDCGRLFALDPNTVRTLLAQGAPLSQIAKLSPPELTTVSSVNPSLVAWLVHILGATLSEIARLSTSSLQRLSGDIVPNYRPAHRDEVITDIRPESVTHPWQLAGASLAFETHSGQRIIVSRNTNPSLYNRALNLLLQRSQDRIDSLRAQLGLPPEPNVNVAELTTNVLVKHDDPSAGYYTVGQLAIKNLLDDYRGGFVIRHGIASTQGSVVTYRLNDGTALVVDKNRLKTDRAKLTFEHLLAGRTVSEAELQHLESDDGSEDLFGGDDWDTWMRVTTRLAHSDPRSQLARALEARNALANGYQLLPYYEQPGAFGSTRRIYPGGESNPTLQTATSADLRAILNEGAINNRVNSLMANPTIQADYQAALSSAINSLPNKQAVADALYNALTGSTYLDVLRGLNDQQLGFEAEQMTQRDLSALSLLDPARSLDAAQKLRINSLSSEFQDLANDPSKINEETFGLALTDATKIAIQSLRSSMSIIRHTTQSADDLIKYLNETISDKKTVDALARVMKELVIEAKRGGISNLANINQHQLEEAMSRTYLPLAQRGAAANFFATTQKFGLWGSIGAAASVASFAYRLSQGAWSSGSSAIDRWGAARDVFTFFSSIGHVAKSSAGVIDFLRTQILGTDPNSQLAWKALGLDRTLPEVWGKTSFLPKGQSWSDLFQSSPPIDTPSNTSPESPRASAPHLQAYVDATDQMWAHYDDASNNPASLFPDMPDEARPLLQDAAGNLSQVWLDTSDSATKIKMPGMAARIGASAIKILHATCDLAGIADIVLGAIGLKKAIDEGDKGMIAANALAIGGGAALTSAGIIGTASLVASVAPVVAAAAAPLFLVGAVLALAGFAVTMIVASVKRHNQLQDSSNDQTDWFRNLAREGLTHHDWFDRLEYLRYAYAIYGNDNTDPNMSYFEFQQAEWDYFRNTPQKSGSSLNRLNDNLHVYTDLTWEPPNSGDDSPHWGS